MRRTLPLIALALVVIACSPAPPQKSEPVGAASRESGAPAAKAERPPVSGPLTAIELDTPGGPLEPIYSMKAYHPAADPAHLSVSSGGGELVIAATLAGPPDGANGNIIELFVDADDNPATGVQFVATKGGGFEYRIALDVCTAYRAGSASAPSSCSGYSKTPADQLYASLDVWRFIGTQEHPQDWLIGASSSTNLPAKKSAGRFPAHGNRFAAKLEYSDLGLRPGQTVRILPRKSGMGESKQGELLGLLPEVHLRLQ